MRNLAFAAMLLLECSTGCVPDAVDLDLGTSAVPDGADGGDAREGGIRILSDVMPPELADRSSGGGGASSNARDGALTDSLGDAPALGDSVGRSDGSPSDTALDPGMGRDPKGDVSTGPSDAPRDLGREARDVKTEAYVDAGAGRDIARADACGDCVSPATHLLITEVVTRPAGAEFVEILNPTSTAVALSDYLLSDSHLYYEIVAGAFTTASGSDFAARFPEDAMLEPGHRAVVAVGNASGGSQSFAAIYGMAPDFELRPTANQATDDPAVPNMVALGTSIGANASLTDSGEPVVLFFYRDGDLVADVDYVFYGAASTSNPVVDKTGVMVGASAYRPDTPASAQRTTAAPGETGSIHRCFHAESSETAALGNGLGGHDETSEDLASAFRLGTTLAERTPGGPAPAALCAEAGELR